MNLHNIAPATKAVPLGRGAVEVTGLSLRKLENLVVDYPELVSLAVGGKVDLASFIVRAPDASLAIFSLGCVRAARRRWWWGWWRRATTLDDAALMKAFDQAPAGQQVGILAAIVELTFSGGERAAPFLKRLAAAVASPAPTMAETRENQETPESSMPPSSSG